jgi:hypothetical protein
MTSQQIRDLANTARDAFIICVDEIFSTGTVSTESLAKSNQALDALAAGADTDRDGALALVIGK